MSYHLYRTPAFVLSNSPQGEGSRTVHLYTKEFGYITARAQGARELRSKLRYHLEPLSHVEVTLVRGRDIWRLTGVSHGELSDALARDLRTRTVVARFFSLVRRMVAGEERDENIYGDVERAVALLSESQCSEEELNGAEVLLALRLLSSLGYIRKEEGYRHLLESAGWDIELLRQSYVAREHAVRAINYSLRESQL